MAEKQKGFKDRLKALQKEFEASLAERQRRFKYRIEGARITFQDDVLRLHRSLRKSALKSLADSRLRNLIAAPFIYSVVLPILLLDIFATVYQTVCFPLWGIAPVRRADHVIFDRHRLAYLNWIQKLNCIYCEYANGLLPYVAEIASRTEQYWCPIKHATRPRHPHQRYFDFIEYGDADDFAVKYEEQREHLLSEAAEAAGGNVTEKDA